METALHLAKWLYRTLRIQRLVGSALFLISAFYLGRALVRLDPLGRTSVFDSAANVEFILLATGYGLALLLLARAWAVIADPERQLSQKKLVIIYGRSTLAKYIPGAIFQYGTRQWLGGEARLRQSLIARASAIEIVLHLSISILITFIAGASVDLAPSAFGIGAGALLIGLAAIAHRYGQRALLTAAGLQTCFFLIFWLLTLRIGWIVTHDPVRAAALATVFLAGWLTGFVLPFVPGGIGVREAVIVALGGQLADPATLLTFAALTRLMTLGGDLGLGLASYLLPVLDARLNRQASARQ